MILVEIFDEEHEKDLQYKVNSFLRDLNENEIIDIKFSVHAFLGKEAEQIYCYSAMVIYRTYK